MEIQWTHISPKFTEHVVSVQRWHTDTELHLSPDGQISTLHGSNHLWVCTYEWDAKLQRSLYKSILWMHPFTVTQNNKAVIKLELRSWCSCRLHYFKLWKAHAVSHDSCNDLTWQWAALYFQNPISIVVHYGKCFLHKDTLSCQVHENFIVMFQWRRVLVSNFCGKI